MYSKYRSSFHKAKFTSYPSETYGTPTCSAPPKFYPFTWKIPREIIKFIISFYLNIPQEDSNGDWDTEADCMSSMNQGPCWDAGDMLGWGKAQGKAETSACLSLDWERLLNITIHWKKRWAADSLTACQDAACPLAHWHTSVWGCTCPMVHQHTGHCPPQEGFTTTRHWLQTCLGDADKQDWILKE
jgi:hypothetical protein